MGLYRANSVSGSPIIWVRTIGAAPVMSSTVPKTTNPVIACVVRSQSIGGGTRGMATSRHRILVREMHTAQRRNDRRYGDDDEGRESRREARQSPRGPIEHQTDRRDDGQREAESEGHPADPIESLFGGENDETSAYPGRKSTVGRPKATEQWRSNKVTVMLATASSMTATRSRGKASMPHAKNPCRRSRSAVPRRLRRSAMLTGWLAGDSVDAAQRGSINEPGGADPVGDAAAIGSGEPGHGRL